MHGYHCYINICDMKNIFSSFFLIFSILIYSNPNPISASKIVAPETSSATVTINEGATVQINLSDYATISSGSIDEYEIVTQPVHKATNNGFVHNGGGTYTYTHNLCILCSVFCLTSYDFF